jgi:hypothetical protein
MRVAFRTRLGTGSNERHGEETQADWCHQVPIS